MHAHRPPRPRPRSRWTMERFIEETFGAKPLFEASKLLHEAQALVEELRTAKDVAVRRRIGALLSRLTDVAELHHWIEETDLIASAQAGWNKTPLALQRHLRASLRQVEIRLHDRLLNTVVTRLKSRRR